ncbi:MAG: NAD-dependent malic enzyme [candidate division NC10 bacterium]|nr:NAD-dependent malic enzyme [candidate division NC10 bacterium]
MLPKTSASYSITMRVEIQNRIGMLGRVTSAIGKAGGDIGAVDIAGFGKETVIRDITVSARDEAHEKLIAAAVGKLPGVKVVNVSDRTFLAHLGGKIEVRSKSPIKTRSDLSMVYTPGVARVCMAIHQDPGKAHQLTIKKNTVAVITDGSAVLGLGNIGPAAALPVMEGKAALFKEFAGVDAFPICLDTQDSDEIVRTAKYIATGFGGINLEDISAPRCFEIEERLQKEVDIPVFHDDQHGTAVVVLAALLNGLRIVKKKLRDLKIVVSGVGASGIACTKILMAMGARNLIGLDTKGALYRGRTENMNAMKEWYVQATNPHNLKGDILQVIAGADMFLGLSGPGSLPLKALRKMARDPIVFAMANPIPEIMPEEAAPYVRVMATGRSDYPNQINNVLCFPGFFRGLLEARASHVNQPMKIAAAKAIASLVGHRELSEEYIIPSVFDTRVAPAVAAAVARAAYQTAAARRTRKSVGSYRLE